MKDLFKKIPIKWRNRHDACLRADHGALGQIDWPSFEAAQQKDARRQASPNRIETGDIQKARQSHCATHRGNQSSRRHTARLASLLNAMTAVPLEQRSLKACLLGVLALPLFIGELHAQEFVFSDGFEDCSPGTRVFWDGGGDGISWISAANWQGNAIPAEGDSVSVRIFSPQTIVYGNALGTRSISCLDSTRALSVTGGNLEITKSGTVGSSVTVSGGTLKVTGQLRVEVQ